MGPGFFFALLGFSKDLSLARLKKGKENIFFINGKTLSIWGRLIGLAWRIPKNKKSGL